MGVDKSQLDLDIAQLLEGFSGAGAPSFSLETMGEARAMLNAFPADFGGTPPEVESVREWIFPNPNSGAELPLKARLYTPALWSAEKGLVLYFHGGGFVMGGLESHDGVCRMLADFGGMAVCAVDYRLAPEHPFPAAVEDCVTAYEWVRSEQGLGIAPEKLAIAGDSAGGNLTAAMVLYARNNNLPMPALQVLIYPLLLMREVTESMNTLREGFFLTLDDLLFFERTYLGDGEIRPSYMASPLLAEDFSGLPETIIHTAGFDPLSDHGSLYAEKLRRAGVEVELEEHVGMIHGFFNFTGVSAYAQSVVSSTAKNIASKLLE